MNLAMNCSIISIFMLKWYNQNLLIVNWHKSLTVNHELRTATGPGALYHKRTLAVTEAYASNS